MAGTTEANVFQDSGAKQGGGAEEEPARGVRSPRAFTLKYRREFGVEHSREQKTTLEITHWPRKINVTKTK